MEIKVIDLYKGNSIHDFDHIFWRNRRKLNLPAGRRHAIHSGELTVGVANWPAVSLAYSVWSLVVPTTSFLLSKNFRLELWPNRLADFWFFKSGWKFEVSITLNKLLKKIDQKMILFFQKRRVKNEAVFESVFSVYKICVFFMHPFFAVCERASTLIFGFHIFACPDHIHQATEI